METSSIIFLLVSASLSFGVGRLIKYFLDKKRAAKKDQLHQREQQALLDAPPEPESKNKSKRKRQLQQIDRSHKP
jgi:hypothetical protein